MVSLSQQNTAISLNQHSTNSGGYKDCQTVWQHCLEIIKSEIPEQSFNTWFIPVRPLRLRQNILTIQVPSLYFYEFLEEHYVLVLRKAIIEQLGTNGKLEYSLLPEKKQPLFDNSFEREKPVHFYCFSALHRWLVEVLQLVLENSQLQ